MTQGAVAFLNDRWLPAAELAIPVTDAGFVLGVTVAEQMRTFRGRLFRLSEHLARLARSLEIVGLQPRQSLAELGAVADELAARNHRLLADGDDLGLSLFVTPGPYSTFQPEGGEPLVGMHTYPLPFRLWAEKYAHGQVLVATDVRQVPASCWPPELKCRSRMHYFLADRAARRLEPAARAMMLDMHGHVTEASTANIVLYHSDGGFVSPPDEDILPGVSVSVLRELALGLGVGFGSRPLDVADVETADEVLLTSTSPCVLPVTRVNGRAIGGGQPGEVYQRLLGAWGALVGVDIADQARRFAHRAGGEGAAAGPPAARRLS